jgi:hypothetical protein
MKKLKLYLLTQSDNTGYDTYDSCIVAEYSARKAKKIDPENNSDSGYCWKYSWANKPENVSAEFIGYAKKGIKPGTVLISSFTAG